MIERTGNIFDSGAAALVNPVNCVGISGAGLAKAVALRYPQWAAAYKAAAKRGEIRIGHVWRHAADIAIDAPLIYALPTKRHWREPSRLEDVAAGLEALAVDVCHSEFPPTSLALPAVGCGLGSLPWGQVRPLIEAAAERMERAGVTVYLYPPGAL